jgi:hypothetical protein
VLTLPLDRAVPEESVRFESVENQFVGAGLVALRVQIVDSHQPAALPVAGIEVAGRRREQRAEVQRAGWRRRKPACVKRLSRGAAAL